MKFRRCMSAIYSSALVLGLTFLFYPETTAANADKPAQVEVSTPTDIPDVTPVPNSPTDISFVTAAPTQTPDKLPEPTPTSIPEERVHPLFLDELYTPSSGVTKLVTSYIESYYSGDMEALSGLVTDASLLNATLIEKNIANISEVKDIKLYSKTGIDDIFSVVYATYSLYYSDTLTTVPQFSEFYIKRYDNGSFRVYIAPLPNKTKESMLKSKCTESVLTLAISSLIQRFNIACLTGNEALMKQCVTDADYLNLDFYRLRYAITENFSDYEFYLYPGMYEIDYILLVSYKEKIVFADTPAPSIDWYYISLDPATGVPYIFLGMTSLDFDAYYEAFQLRDDIQALGAQIKAEMTEALQADDDLNDFYNSLKGETAE